MSAVMHTSEQRWGLTQHASGFLPISKAQKGWDLLPLACVSELEQEDRCCKKDRHQNQRLSICVPATPGVHISSGSPLLVFSMHFGTKGRSKLCFSAGRLLRSFFPDERLRFRCRAVPGVSAGSLWPPSMWLIHLTNLCHRIIVCRWSVHWQMTCDQFYHNAASISWEIEWHHFIRWKKWMTMLLKFKCIDMRY